MWSWGRRGCGEGVGNDTWGHVLGRIWRVGMANDQHLIVLQPEPPQTLGGEEKRDGTKHGNGVH